MGVVSSKSSGARWYTVSFLLLLVPVAEFASLHGQFGEWPLWLIVAPWGTSGVGGLFCAILGGGGFNKKPLDFTGTLAVTFHFVSIAWIMLIAFTEDLP
jgi:hypothetical protein